MLVFMIVVMVLAGLALVGYGFEKGKRGLTAAGILFIAAVIFISWFMGFYADFLWFSALDYDHRFWKEFLAKTGIALGSGVIAAAAVERLTLRKKNQPWWIRWRMPFLAVVPGVLWGKANWDVVLRFFWLVSA